MASHLREGLKRYFTPAQLEALARARVGIAGAGGLGSNAAMLLARSGVRDFVIIDRDIIEPSNLNRQHYWPGQVGKSKVLAIQEHLRNLDPEIQVEALRQSLAPENMGEILAKADIWVEALDEASLKKAFVESALAAGLRVASASGIAGYGREPLKKRRLGNLVIVGDFVTDIGVAPPLAPRVAQAAAMLADCALEFILPPQAPNP